MAAQHRIVRKALELRGGRRRVAGLDQERGLADGIRHAANRGRDHRQARRERLEQRLRQPLGPGHVQEGVARAIHVEQAVGDRHVAEQVGVVGDTEVLEPLPELAFHRALAAHEQPEPLVALPQARQHVGQQQRVLLGLQPADGQHAQLPAVPHALCGIVRVDDLVLADE